MKLRLFLVSTLSSLITSGLTNSIFNKTPFLTENLINTGSLGLPSSTSSSSSLGLVVAFGDFNADQLLDLFYLSSDQRTLSTYLWDRPSYSFKENIQSRIRTESNFIIVNVVPGDWDYDGKLDLLVMGSKNPGGWWGDDEELEMKVYLQRSNGTFSEPYDVDSSIMAQPMPFDASGDMKPDLFGFSSQNKKFPSVWTNVWESSNHTKTFDLTPPPPFVNVDSFNCTFPNPHSNGYIDLDGDCLADLFLMCTKPGGKPDELTYQIWINDKVGGYSLKRIGDLPKGTKSVGFADMDRDGTMDLIITSCPSTNDCHLAIAYNIQVPLCTSTSAKAIAKTGPCRDPEALCVADQDFKFDFSTEESNDAFTTIPISILLPSSTLITLSTSFRGTFPISPQPGDFNKDGYPDLLLLTSSSGKKHVNLLESRPCVKGSCTGVEIETGRRAFRVVKEGAEVLEDMGDVESVHWVDVDDDGSLDIMIQRGGNSGAGRRIEFIKNNYFHDAFFLKALVLNGACQAWCEPQEVGESRYRPYGVSYSGASYKFTVLDPSGVRKATQVGQLPQSSYLALGTPYSYFGLGRTNNYVENLFIGSTRHQPEHFINVEGLIPNSQVVIDPWQPKDRNEPSSWSRELYLHPGDWIPWVTIVLGAAIMLMAGVVFALHLNEKRADELERRSTLNFHAL